jgi:hypothetical protein
MTMHTYLVQLADRQTGKDQRILVLANSPDNMQEFVSTLPDLKVENPIVIAIHKLAIKRPLPRTNMRQAVKSVAAAAK